MTDSLELVLFAAALIAFVVVGILATWTPKKTP
jgi:hypothetical protein